MKTYEVHRKVKDNVGDYYCNPSRYFDFTDCTSGELVNNKFLVKDQILIIGGGGLIHKKFNKSIETLLHKNPKHTIIWGIGHNFGRKHVTKSNTDVYYPKWLNKCSLIGIRDWITGHHESYLPCVSCMHPAFDKTYKTKHDVVYYTHKFKSKYEYQNEYAHMSNNNINFDEVIAFLGSAKTIITDSYHGAYWGQLLGKDVRVLSWSVKFDHMKYQPTRLPHISSWKDSDPSIIPANYLDECRTYNKKFYQKFLNLL